MFRLEELGWSNFFEAQCHGQGPDDCFPARVSVENRRSYTVLFESGEAQVEIAGKLRYEAASRADLPAVGDWVLVRKSAGGTRVTIHRVFTRRTRFSRKTAGRQTEEQIIAANVDTVLLVCSLNREFNMRRLERYLSLAWESGARPVVVLNKTDLCCDAESFRREAEMSASGVPVLMTSAVLGRGIDELRDALRGATTALLGSSGVGKSTLINAIIGKTLQPTSEIRADDDRGRHTTTSRQLIVAPGGIVLIDTPGMRGLQLWDAELGLSRAFADIQELAQRCRFRDCAHRSEPGCAVLSAIEQGSLAPERLESFRKLSREEQFLEAKHDAALRAERTKAVKRIMKDQKEFYRGRYR